MKTKIIQFKSFEFEAHYVHVNESYIEIVNLICTTTGTDFAELLCDVYENELKELI